MRSAKFIHWPKDARWYGVRLKQNRSNRKTPPPGTMLMRDFKHSFLADQIESGLDEYDRHRLAGKLR
jgi:hypothetical protein